MSRWGSVWCSGRDCAPESSPDHAMPFTYVVSKQGYTSDRGRGGDPFHHMTRIIAVANGQRLEECPPPPPDLASKPSVEKHNDHWTTGQR